MRTAILAALSSIRQLPLWMALGLLLASLLHGYWLISCILLVGVVVLVVLLQ